MKARLSLLAALLALGAPAPALAKSDKDFTYRYQAVWSTAVRLIRADKGYKVTDKDKENGYLLFIYPGSGSVKECQASMEILPHVDQEGFHKIRVQLRIAHQPSYIEVHILDSLERKLAEEQGPAPPPRKKQKPGKKKPAPPPERIKPPPHLKPPTDSQG